MSRTTVADLVVDGLKRAGTPRLVGVARAGADPPMIAAARALGLPVTLVAGDEGACVVAAVSGDLTDTPGAVALGATPAVLSSAICEGLAGAPLIVVTSGWPSPLPGCKESLRVEADSAAHRIAHAARLAMSAPRGPVHLEMPPDVAGRAAIPVATSCRPDPVPYPPAEALDRAARALSDAARPLLLAGRHCRSSDAAQWLRAFVEALPAPLLATAPAKGVLPDPHPLMLGVLGVAGVEESLLSRADLVVAVGLDAAEVVPATCWTTAPVLAVGPVAAPDGRPPTAQVLGEVSAILEELAARLRDKPRADWDVAELDRLRRAGAARGAGAGLTAQVVRLAREASPAGTIATADAGPYGACVATAWHAIAPREFLPSSGRAHAGFALPAAIAAHLAHPDRRTVCFTGASDLAAAPGELETAARLGARIVIVAFDGDAAASSGTGPADTSRVPVSAAHDDATFARGFARALAAEGPSLIIVRPR